MRRLSLVLVSLFLLVLPLFAQGADVTDVVADTGQAKTTRQIKEAQVVVSKQAEAEARQLKKEQAAAARANKKRQRNERTDKLLGVVYLPRNNYDLKKGLVQVSLRGSTGSFNIYALREKGAAVPVLSTVDDSSTSYFSVLVDGLEYRLNHDAGVTPEVRELDDGCQLAYTLEKRVQVVIDFSLLSSVPGTPCDMVRLMVYVTSLSDKAQTVAVKALFDTVLGENTDYHFTTGSGMAIDSARQFLSLTNERWIASSNGKTAVQFLLAGKTISTVESVSVANRDELYRSRWIPSITEQKGFNAVHVYNNSALAVTWPQFELEAKKTETLTMYLVVASDGAAPKGDTFLGVNAPVSGATVSGQVQDDVWQPVVVTDRQLDPAYIQALINRINNLQSDPKLVDRTEVRRLNAELDAIFEKMRQVQ